MEVINNTVDAEVITMRRGELSRVSNTYATVEQRLLVVGWRVEPDDTASPITLGLPHPDAFRVLRVKDRYHGLGDQTGRVFADFRSAVEPYYRTHPDPVPEAKPPGVSLGPVPGADQIGIGFQQPQPWKAGSR